jgi:tRNA (guanine-N7-)-methyltransferase
MRSGSPQNITHGRRDRWDTGGVLLPDSAATTGPLDFRGLFGNARPVEVEIGCGKGTFILARAAGRPDVNFLGIEWARSYCEYTADRVRRAGLRNVRMLSGDAAEFFPIGISDASLWRLHVYFPDPWPKKKHHRRRLIRPSFMEQIRRVLRPGGQLLVVTDHRGYFTSIRGIMQEAQGFMPIEFPKMTGGEEELVGTNFEKKYIAQGRPFFAVALMRYV